MFGDLFGGGVSAEDVNQSNQAHAVNFLTLTLVLVEKGIISADEIKKARVQATGFVDQEWAKKREQQEKEFDEKHPGLRKLFGQILGGSSSV